MLYEQLVRSRSEGCYFLVERKCSAKFDKIQNRGLPMLNSGQQERRSYRELIEIFDIEELRKEEKNIF